MKFRLTGTIGGTAASLTWQDGTATPDWLAAGLPAEDPHAFMAKAAELFDEPPAYHGDPLPDWESVPNTAKRLRGLRDKYKGLRG